VVARDADNAYRRGPAPGVARSAHGALSVDSNGAPTPPCRPHAGTMLDLYNEGDDSFYIDWPRSLGFLCLVALCAQFPYVT